VDQVENGKCHMALMRDVEIITFDGDGPHILHCRTTEYSREKLLHGNGGD